MKIAQHPSPNHDTRGEAPIEMLVMHYTGMRSGAEALARLCDPQAKVSAHYLVEEDGCVFQLVDEGERAWHAGVASWRGLWDVNARSIGIEIVNPGHEWGYTDFPQAQMEAVAALSQAILARHAIPARNVVGHSDVAFRRKQDPGERFNWEWLAQQGVGLWPVALQPRETFPRIGQGEYGESVRQLQELLVAYGYDMPIDGGFEEVTRLGVEAFQRHFRPERVNGEWDGACQARLEALLSYC